MAEKILWTKSLSKHFGGLKAVDKVNIYVEKGDIFGLIGPNGAGKTTLQNCIAGTYPPTSGQVIYRGKDITGFKPHRVCRHGINRTYQIVRSFPRLSALQNVMVGGVFGARLSEKEARAKALKLLEFVEFPSDPEAKANSLNTMQLKRVEMAKALASGCKLLFLDEVAAGLTPGELVDIIALIRRIRDSGVTILIVEHLMKLIMEVCNRIAVLCFGELLIMDTPEVVTRDERVLKAYLGDGFQST
ncbi:MAG: ABC transporter ATP-binding protein [Deltaproteobacteria bacterium]|jgi:branched-chain amino acid transport system ATP-binding protein|nr:ABC transporter ATP-binding protein [Deltaproteobacteria bacterium]